MAALTSHSRMRAGQGKVAAAMIEVRVVPIRRVMTGSTVCTILTVMFVISLVAGVAICGRAFVLIVQMAGFTSHVRMLTF